MPGRRRGPRRGGGGGFPSGDAKEGQEPAVEGEAAKVPREPREPAVMENPKFEAYYQRQGICAEAQWPDFLASMRCGLPAAMRVNFGAHTSEALLEQLGRLQGAEGDKKCYAPRPLEWYPRGLAWQWDELCSWSIRKDPLHKLLKAYLVWLQDKGAITRQEAVSMIPPLCLDVRPEHTVVDLCAAPGSKASQMLEMLHWQDAGKTLPKGVIIANEIDPKRRETLTHTLNRIQSPSIIVTQIDAQFFPNITGLDGKVMKFDRVLADVPCSGDGTIRKFPEMWNKWSPKDANGLHHRQYTILCRGLDMLRVGGRCVYSTCSFNPVEDEAVVAAALRKFEGSVELRPIPVLPGLEGNPGLVTWVVPHSDDAGVWWERHEDVPEDLKGKIRASLFPPDAGTEAAETWAGVCGHCRRFLPHASRSGGFFVAAFERVSDKASVKNVWSTRAKFDPPERQPPDLQPSVDPDAVAEVREDVAEVKPDVAALDEAGAEVKPDVAPEDGEGQAKPKRVKKPKEVKFWDVGEHEIVQPDDPDWARAAGFFGLDSDLRAKIRRVGKKLYCVSDSLGVLLTGRSALKLKIGSCGLRIMEQMGPTRDGGPPSYRLAQEGIHVLVKFGLRRRIALSRPLFTKLLTCSQIPTDELCQAALRGEVEGLHRTTANAISEGAEAATPDRMPPIEEWLPGSVAVTLLPEPGQEKPPSVVIVALLSRRILESFVNRVDGRGILESLDLESQTSAILAGVRPAVVAQELRAEEPRAEQQQVAK